MMRALPFPSLATLSIVLVTALQARAQPVFENLNHHSTSNYQDRVPACRRRGEGAYCSAGSVGGYIGPLDTARQLRDALAQTAFKNEIIIFSDTRIMDASQAVSRMRGGAGYGHVLPVLPTANDCHRLARVFLPFTHEQGPLSCGSYAATDESGQPLESGFRYLRTGYGMTAWWRKWFTVIRAVFLGYNVMAIDSDVLVLDDWYWRVKQPPMSNYNLISQAECDICINGGFSYVQNASSSGPVAWVLFEAMHRAVRWAEDNGALVGMSKKIAKEPMWGTCPDDQTLLSDALWNTLNGDIRFASMRCMIEEDEELMNRMGIHNEVDFMAANGPPSSSFVLQEYELNEELAQVACEGFRDPTVGCTEPSSRVTIRTAVMKMPHSDGVWAMEHGGYPFNPRPGPFTQAYRQAMKDLDVPLPPDPEDPSTVAQANATAPELFGLLHTGPLENCTGCWLESQWFSAGRIGLWHTHLNPPRIQSIGHVHAGLYPGDLQKVVVLQAAGHFDWRVAGRVSGSPSRLFFANFPATEAYLLGHQDQAFEIPRVVSYSPGVIYSKISKEDFIRAVEGLAKVAASLGAVAAWPAAPCDVDWVLTPEALAAGGPPPLERLIPWYHLRTQFTVLPFGDSRQDLKCEWVGFATAGCLMNQRHYGEDSGRSLLAMEFDHLLRHHTHNSTTQRRPTQETLLRLSVDNQEPPVGSWQEIHYDQLLHLNTEMLLQQLHEQDPIPIFWVDRLVGAVHGMTGIADAVYGTWRRRCRALRYWELPEGERQEF